MTSAATTRWTMNWYECSWSWRDGIHPPQCVMATHTMGRHDGRRRREATR
jgi:hypothetical protein